MAALTSVLEVAAGFLGLLLVAEFVARWALGRRAYYVWSPGVRMRLHPDPEIFPELERVVRFEVNSDGERGDEAPRSKRGVYRILVAGGSAVEGYLLDQLTNWPAVAQRIAREVGISQIHVSRLTRRALEKLRAEIGPGR